MGGERASVKPLVFSRLGTEVPAQTVIPMYAIILGQGRGHDMLWNEV